MSKSRRRGSVLPMDGRYAPLKPVGVFGLHCVQCDSPTRKLQDSNMLECERCGIRQSREQIDAKMIRAGEEHLAKLRESRASRPSKAYEAWKRKQDRAQKRKANEDALKRKSRSFVGSNVVYYIRFRDTLKIGTSVNVKSRVSCHPWEELLAIEPGDYKLEAKRHKQFKEFAVAGEWYDLNDASTHMVDEIREASMDWFESVFHKCPPLPQLKRHVVWPEPEDYPSAC